MFHEFHLNKNKDFLKKGCARQRRTQSRVEDRTLIGRLLFAPFSMFLTRRFSPHSARTVLLSLALIPERGGLRKVHTAGLGLARDRRGTGHQALLTLCWKVPFKWIS